MGLTVSIVKFFKFVVRVCVINWRQHDEKYSIIQVLWLHFRKVSGLASQNTQKILD